MRVLAPRVAVWGVLPLVIASGASADVVSWHRATDWMPGVPNGTENNPGPDAGGAPVWFYGWTSGGGLDSENPWFTQPVNMSVWDDNFYAYGEGAWAKGDDSNPPILDERLVHRLGPTTYENIPVVQWLNPMEGSALVDVSGSLTVEWNGIEGMGFPCEVEVIVAMYDASLDTTMALYSASVGKPINDVTYRDSLELPILLSEVQMEAGDSLIISHRAEMPGFDAGWVNLYDDLTINVEAVPAPGAAGLLALGGLALARRRRA